MCGIAGIFDIQDRRAPSEIELRRMVAQLEHRGPDGEGFYLSGGVGLAHARLSIIDLAGGGQPIHNETRTVWVVFNGEIFNYIELREDLEKRGHEFYTSSDTEVLVHLYEEYDDAFVHKLNGQFAIALWDERRRRLLLVRDRPGILPLYYTVENGRLLFGSEVKSILAASAARAALDPDGLMQLMTFWSTVGSTSMFKSVRQLPPGCLMTVDARGVRTRRYWDWAFPEDGALRRGPVEALADELKALLVDATRIRLRSDVPVGAYLSGGLDSSILASLVRAFGDARLRTFSIRFGDAGLDESAHQREMVRHLDTDHSGIRCDDRDIADRFIDAVWAMESPVLRTAPVPMGMLAALVRKSGYRAVLTGEGADEVFGGYDLFKEAKIRRFWARNRASRFRPLLLKRLYPYLDLPQQAYLQSFFGIGLDRTDAVHFSHMPRWETTAHCLDFLAPEFRARAAAPPLDALVSTLPADIRRWHPFHRAQYLEAKTLMAGYLLSSQGDRMLMAHSVEGRFPYLDHRVIEFGNRLHPSLKLKALNEKYLLKRAFAERLPQRIVERHKQPYRAPDAASFFGGAGPPAYVAELMSPDIVRRYGYFEPEKVRRLTEKIRRGRALGFKDNMAFVGILSTQAWHHLFVEQFHRRVRPVAEAAAGRVHGRVARR